MCDPSDATSREGELRVLGEVGLPLVVQVLGQAEQVDLPLHGELLRDAVLADLAMLNNSAQLAALGVQQNSQDMANRFNQGTA